MEISTRNFLPATFSNLDVWTLQTSQATCKSHCRFSRARLQNLKARWFPVYSENVKFHSECISTRKLPSELQSTSLSALHQNLLKSSLSSWRSRGISGWHPVNGSLHSNFERRLNINKRSKRANKSSLFWFSTPSDLREFLSEIYPLKMVSYFQKSWPHRKRQSRSWCLLGCRLS